ncbi:Alpha-N-acetylgalactosaminidase (Alpha-galactosidase B), partial [Durusdinium trenchii]
MPTCGMIGRLVEALNIETSGHLEFWAAHEPGSDGKVFPFTRPTIDARRPVKLLSRRNTESESGRFLKQGSAGFSLKPGEEYKFCWCLVVGREIQRVLAGQLFEADGAELEEAESFHREELPMLFPTGAPEAESGPGCRMIELADAEALGPGDGYAFTGHLDLFNIARAKDPARGGSRGRCFEVLGRTGRPELFFEAAVGWCGGAEWVQKRPTDSPPEGLFLNVRQPSIVPRCEGHLAWRYAAVALENGLALTPPMGWMTWQRYRCNMDCDSDPSTCINEQLIKEMADRMAEAARGERSPVRGYFCVAVPISGREGKGLKFATYGDIGAKTCQGFTGFQGSGRPGEFGAFLFIISFLTVAEADAQTFAEWKVDYLKVDGCFESPKDMARDYPAFGAALNQTGRPIVYSCSWPAYMPSHCEKSDHCMDSLVEHCNLWRNFDDVARLGTIGPGQLGLGALAEAEEEGEEHRQLLAPPQRQRRDGPRCRAGALERSRHAAGGRLWSFALAGADPVRAVGHLGCTALHVQQFERHQAKLQGDPVEPGDHRGESGPVGTPGLLRGRLRWRSSHLGEALG